MESVIRFRDVVSQDDQAVDRSVGGRSCIAVIGIDRYRTWEPLRNAVQDARGTLDLFTQLGFEPVCEPLFDDEATGAALRCLPDRLGVLGPDDRLVLFLAGHGHTVTRTYPGGASVKKGYVIPVDGDGPEGNASTWLRLDTWLSDIAQVPIRHLLVVLDACHSGVALDPTVRWRGQAISAGGPLGQLGMRRSRRIITSALDNELAMDSGPIAGHSLFTGCLIEGLTGGLLGNRPSALVTGTDIGRYIQRRVIDYPNSKQTPDFGALELDDRGELIVRLAVPGDKSQHEPVTRSPTAVAGDIDVDPSNGTGDAANTTPTAAMESPRRPETEPEPAESIHEAVRIIRDESQRRRHRSSKLAGGVVIGSLIGAALVWGMSRQSSGLPGAGHDAATTVTRNAAPPPSADARVGAMVANDAAPPAMPVPDPQPDQAVGRRDHPQEGPARDQEGPRVAAERQALGQATARVPGPAAASAAPKPSATPTEPRRFVWHGRVLINGKDCTTNRDLFTQARALPPCPETSEDSPAAPVRSTPSGRRTSEPISTSAAGVVEDPLFRARS